jgi:hypothetical protein
MAGTRRKVLDKLQKLARETEAAQQKGDLVKAAESDFKAVDVAHKESAGPQLNYLTRFNLGVSVVVLADAEKISKPGSYISTLNTAAAWFKSAMNTATEREKGNCRDQLTEIDRRKTAFLKHN